MNHANLVLLGSLLASGCAIVEPYGRGVAAGIYDCSVDAAQAVDVGNTHQKKKANKLANICQLAPGPQSLPRAIATAQELQRKYISAAGEHEFVRTAAGATVIGGASYALLMGVSDGIAPANATDQIAAIGAGAAAMLAVTNLTTSPRRQEVWLAGAKAVSCAVGRSTPFLLDDRTSNSIDRSISELTSLVALLHMARARAAARTPDTELTAAISDADLAIAAGDLAAGQGMQVLFMRNTGASTGLLNALREIDSDVMLELRKAQPDIGAIIASVDGLKGFAARISSAYAPAPADSTAGKSDDSIKRALFTLMSEASGETGKSSDDDAKFLDAFKYVIAEVRRRTDAVRSVVGPVIDSASAAGAPSDCNLEAVIIPVSVEPNAIEFKSGAADSKIVKIKGGDAPFIAEYSEPVTGFGVNLGSPFSRDILISVSDKATGSATLYVKDRTGAKAPLVVTTKKEGK